MNKTTLTGTIRNKTGSSQAQRLRRSAQVPCVLYGGDGTVHFSVEERELSKLVFTPEVRAVEIDLGERKALAMVHAKQFHPVTDRVIHVDFMEVREDRPAPAMLSIRLKGQPEGVRKGGRLNQTMRKVRVLGHPSALPPRLEVDVTGLGLNQSLHISDLKFEGLELDEDPEAVVATVKMPKKVEEAASAAVAAPAAGAAPASGEAAKPAAEAKPAEAKPAPKK
jgi:large subunit ribosomal protein L25